MTSDENIQASIQELTTVERKVLPCLLKETNSLKIQEITELKDVEVLRAYQWLANKNLATISKKEQEFINLDTNGELYLKRGLPEKAFLSLIEKEPKFLSELEKKLSKEEINVCIGLLKRQGAINIEKKGTELQFSITLQGLEFLKKRTPEEDLLSQKFPLEEKNLDAKLKSSLKELLQRKNILKKEIKTEWTAILTEDGKKVAKHASESKQEFVDKLTPKMLKDGSWRGKQFRTFDVQSKVPRKMRGKKHFVNEAVEYIKSIWLEIGFEEMDGDCTQSAFWDLDSLFVPQDHPAREMQDTFYLDGKAKLPQTLLKKVKKVHEDGADTNSKGWRTPFSTEMSEQIMLRTHTTAISAHTINSLKKEDLPKKYFIVGRVFRNEALDWKHLFEFQQVDGIVIDPEGNMTKLKGYLKEFFLKMGFTDVRIRPAHFPYTEPSAEVEAYNPFRKEWVEMGGCGILRPEVTKTLLGFECPVLAWGLGMERIIASYYNIKDIRELYKNDYEQLKAMKSFTK
jgi:phenylalanyl-tRNA synthetase alpha chain